MKKFLTVQDINAEHNAGKKQIFCDSTTILTPSARDRARELGLEIVIKELAGSIQVCDGKNPQDISAIKKLAMEQGKLENLSFSDDDVNIILKEVLNKLNTKEASEIMIKEADPSGIRLIRGHSVICDSFDTGNPKDRVGIKEILTTEESPNLATGFMTFEKSSFDWTLGYDEMDYIVEGNLDIIVNGKTYHGNKGDCFLIPMGTRITFSVPDYCKFFFVTYPANWQELSGK